MQLITQQPLLDVAGPVKSVVMLTIKEHVFIKMEVTQSTLELGIRYFQLYL